MNTYRVTAINGQQLVSRMVMANDVVQAAWNCGFPVQCILKIEMEVAPI